MATAQESDVAASSFVDRYEDAESQLFALIAITSRSKRALAERLDERLTPAALPILGMVLRSKRITQSEICEKLMVDKATLSRTVARLEEVGLVTREVDESDRRVSHLLPTEEAIQRWRYWLQAWREDLRRRLTNWTDEDLETLSTLLGRLNEDISTL